MIGLKGHELTMMRMTLERYAIEQMREENGEPMVLNKKQKSQFHQQIKESMLESGKYIIDRWAKSLVNNYQPEVLD